MPKILIVEDDQDLALVVREHLASEKYSADIVSNGRDALSLLKVATFDLIILDWSLPHQSGIQVLAEFRASGGKTPIIMLTGKKEILEKEQGLDTGADDYLTKPFSLVELSARVRALLRRPDTLVSKVLSVNDIELDPIKYSVEKGGAAVHLQPQDFSLLEFLMRHPDQPFTPAALLIRVWGTNSEATVESVRSSVKRLRQKLDDSDGETSIIENIPRIGYRLNSR